MGKRKRVSVEISDLTELCDAAASMPDRVESSIKTLCFYLQVSGLDVIKENVTPDVLKTLGGILKDLPPSQSVDEEFWKTAEGAKIAECLVGKKDECSQTEVSEPKTGKRKSKKVRWA